MNAALTQDLDCDHCHDFRVVESGTLGMIRCPWCTRRTPKMDSSGLEQVSRDEAARREADNARKPAKFTGLDWTITKLNEWGRWVRDRGIGYPPMSTIERARIGRGGSHENLFGSLPPDLEVIDQAVAEAPVDFKAVLIEHYTKFGYAAEKAAHLGISRSTYFTRKASAERYVANAIGV